MDILEYMKANGHEQLTICSDESSGLKAFIAIHSTVLGPACGGVRIWPHKTEDDAILDVLRLSRAMTYKAAVAGLALGGGKAVIIADPIKDKSESLLRAYGRYVNGLAGRYVTTTDVGSTTEDLRVIALETPYLAGLPERVGGSGDTSILTGLGVYLGMRACSKHVWGSESLSKKVVAFQGFGKVAMNTAKHLLDEDVRLVVADVNENAIQNAIKLGARVVDVGEIYDVECDIFSPCALGGGLNPDTIPRLKCRIVAGGANNQLSDRDDGLDLQARGILYAPDYVINAGGLINVSCEMDGNYNAQRAKTLTYRIYDTVQHVIINAEASGISTLEAADLLAEDRINRINR